MWSISAEGQQDDHCRLVCNGQEWWIARKRGDLILLTSETGRSVLDISKVGWPEYTAKAVAMIEEAFGA